MRIVLILTLFLLSACSTARPVSEAPRAKPDLKAAERVCRKKGYDPGTFEYAACYDNRPEVQAYGRDQRMSTLSIIHANRSGGRAGRSYPID